MTTAYIALDRRIPDDDAPRRLLGKALTRNLEALRDLAAEKGQSSVVLCYCLSEKEFTRRAIALANGEDVPPAALVWHDPSDGLTTLRALAGLVRANPLTVDDPDGVLTDLQECIAYLQRADDHDVAFHLERGEDR